MKKWNNPELLTLSVENTFDCFDERNNGIHFCHQTGELHTPPDNKHTNHSRSEKCDMNPHWHNGQQYSKCCCAEFASSGPNDGEVVIPTMS